VTIQFPTKIQGPVAVIGDVHGQVEKLQAVLDQLRELPDYQERWIVFIGDFVDRGSDPKTAIDMTLGLMREHRRTTAIAGNHEFAMGAALGWFPVLPDADWGPRWVGHYNSEQTFASYGVAHGDLEGLNRVMPDTHREFITKLPWVVEHPRCLFVHAGLDRNTPFLMQLRILQQRDFTLNRPPWLCSKTFIDTDPPEDCPVPVASGHVKVPTVQIRPKRILMDTSGGDSGELSCVLLPEKRVISSSGADLAGTATDSKSGWWRLWG
jgi:serine/threonine protein phosphatase 1